MPAQWPLFINNVSAKLASRSLKTSDDMAMLISQEYFNAVKTSQTPFGNIHQSGQKSILDAGFKEAFKQLYESQAPALDFKKLDPNFADLKEALPIPNINANVDKELQDCLNTKPEYIFYDFGFKHSPVITKKLITKINFVNVEVPQITFNGTQGVAPYTFKYSIDGIAQNIITSDESGQITIDIDKSKPGSFEYKLISIKDANGVQNSIDDLVVVIVPESQFEEIVIEENSVDLPKLKEDEIIELLANKVYFQYDNTEEFRLWLDRLSYGVNANLGNKVASLVKKWIKENKNNNLTYNKHQFQSSYEDIKTLPDFVKEKEIIVKFTYHPIKDSVKKAEHKLLMVLPAVTNKHENRIANEKVDLWKIERDRWNTDRIDCINKIANSYKKDPDKGADEAYDKLAKAIIDYWMSTLTKPFQPGPPVPPCVIPTPGTYMPVYYGSQKKLAANLKRALNTGKYFEYPPTIQPASKVVATALAVSFAKHLTELKFIYVGQIYVGVSTAPMIGFVPLVF